MNRNMEGIKTVAIEDYMNGAHCAEVVFKYMGREYADKFDEDIARIATPFGGGIVAKGDLCGALAGGLMLIGFLCGRRKTGDSQEVCRNLSRSYYDRFKEHFGATDCKSIHGLLYNRSTHIKCSETVSDALEILGDVLDMGEQT